MTNVRVVLPLSEDELPDITDAGVGLTRFMVGSLMAERDRQALYRQLATAFEARDWNAVAALHRRLAAVPPAVARMAAVARAGLDRYDAGLADPTSEPAADPRARRSLKRSINWLDRKFWAMYGAVRPVMPPATEAAGPSARPTNVTPIPETPCREPRTPMRPTERPGSAATKPCRKAIKGRLQLLDGELARLAVDQRQAADTARRIMLADRNDHAARCRACGRCRLATDPLTRPIPTQ